MKRQLSPYFCDVEEIEILDDILASYSHAKLNRIYQYENIRLLFEFFIVHNKECFLSSFGGEQKDKYNEALQELFESFEKTS